MIFLEDNITHEEFKEITNHILNILCIQENKLTEILEILRNEDKIK